MRVKYWLITFIIFISTNSLSAQTDYTGQWDDLYSYNNVKEIHETDEKIVALTDNAIFTYEKNSGVIEKTSSVNGLSGQTTSALYYDEILDIIVIGYENGLIECIKSDHSIVIKPDIVNFNIVGSKSINHFSGTPDGQLYISTNFGIIGFDLNEMQFKDTYYIGANSTEVAVYETLIDNQTIYAATDQGVFYASLDNPYLVDSQYWTLIPSQPVSNITIFNNEIVLSISKTLYSLTDNNLLIQRFTTSNPIIDLTTKNNLLTAVMRTGILIYDINYIMTFLYYSESDDEYYFEINTAIADEQNILLGTNAYGILSTQRSNIYQFKEIHPDGPLENAPFSISLRNKQLWVVYGGYDEAYTPKTYRKGISHYNGTYWKNLKYKTGEIEITNLVHVNIDPNHENKVYVSSWHDGMLIIENDEVIMHWTHENSGLEKLYYPPAPNYVSIRIGSSIFDEQGNLWVVNAAVENRLKKYFNGNWTNYNLNDIITNGSWGLNEVVIDQLGNKWIGSRRNGALVFNENSNRMMSYITDPTKGNLPDLNVRTIAVDKNNRVWIGTRAGLRVVDPSDNMFDQNTYQASVIAIAYSDDDQYGEALMGKQTINTICVDGANNKWFGTDNGGVLCTSPNGKETLFQFDKDNSPLPSNKILKIQFDDTSGKVYFATDKGIVSFNSDIAAYDEHLQDVYAYPNPVKPEHEVVTIDGRNGSHLPYGTNVKILDSSGALVYETNVKEGQESYGGKVVWNKRNLAGKKVASGVYIVLLSFDKGKETAITKIAIIN